MASPPPAKAPRLDSEAALGAPRRDTAAALIPFDVPIDAAKNVNEDDDQAVGEEAGVDEAGVAEVKQVFHETSDASLFITKYAAGIPEGLRGDLKAIPEDFIVAEVDKNDAIVTLVQPVLPPSKETAAPQLSGEELAKEINAAVIGLAQALPLVSPELVPDLVRLCTGELPKVDLPPISDKAARSKAHQFIREHIGRWAVSETSKEGGVVQILKANASKRKMDTKRSGGANPPFLYVTLLKRDMDLNHALSELCLKSHTLRKSVGFAGTKDKQAVTFQRISVLHGEPSRLAAACTTYSGLSPSALAAPPGHLQPQQPLGAQYFMIGDAAYHSEPLRLGDAHGNRFAIVLRNLTIPPSPFDLDQAMKAWSERGFLNYYGKQRFGTSSIGTHTLGRALIAREWDLVVELLLKPRDGEPPYLSALREEYAQTKDARELLKKLPRRCTAERAICEGIVRKERPLNALDRVPINLRSIYLHAFQSLIWNAMASARFEAYGADRVVVGDLVMVSKTSADVENAKDFRVRIVETEQDADKCSIADVVLPLPGYSVVYPRAQAINKDAYEAELKKAGVNSLELLRNPQQKIYSLAGGYRRYLEVPKDVQYKKLLYNDIEPVFSSPSEAVQLPPQTPGIDRTAKSVPGGTKSALALCFTLSAGTYATMALRELCR